MSKLAQGGSTVYYPRCRAVLAVVLDGYSSGPGSPDEPMVVPCLPKNCTIHVNGYHQADSWTLGFAYSDLPFDPNLLRSGSAEIYLYDAGGVKSETAVVSRQYAVTGGAARGDDATDAASADAGVTAKRRFVEDQKPRIVGRFDRASMTLNESGRWVEWAGQDKTSDLALQWPPLKSGRARRIPVGTRLDVWAAGILSEVDPAGTMKIDVRGIKPEKLPTVGAVEIANNKRGIPVKQETTYWDVIYKVVTRYGFIAYVSGYDLVITKPKNLDDITEHNVRRLAWGRNLSSLELTRNMGKEKAPRVVIMAYNDGTKEPVRVEYPVAGAVTEEYIIVPVYGISDTDALLRAAQTLHALRGRGERRIVARTMDLDDVDGRPLLDLEAGDAVDVMWQDFNADILANPGLTREARVKHLTDRGFQPDVAATLADGYQRLVARQAPMRVREVTYEFDVEGGVSVELELVDFVMVKGVRDSTKRPPREDIGALLARLGLGGKVSQ